MKLARVSFTEDDLAAPDKYCEVDMFFRHLLSTFSFAANS